MRRQRTAPVRRRPGHGGPPSEPTWSTAWTDATLWSPLAAPTRPPRLARGSMGRARRSLKLLSWRSPFTLCEKRPLCECSVLGCGPYSLFSTPTTSSTTTRLYFLYLHPARARGFSRTGLTTRETRGLAWPCSVRAGGSLAGARVLVVHTHTSHVVVECEYATELKMCALPTSTRATLTLTYGTLPLTWSPTAAASSASSRRRVHRGHCHPTVSRNTLSI